MVERIGLAVVVAFAALGATACAFNEDSSSDETSESSSQTIKNGQPATSFTEAALVDGPGFICSGSVIAPKVALTAGHCVTGASSWTVRTPYAGNQSAHGSSSWTQYVSTGTNVNPNTPDVALIFLDTPINLPAYPPIASAAYANGTQATNVGRIQNNVASSSQLFYGSAVTLTDATSYGFPHAYISNEIIEPGDSGGPVYVGSGASRVISAVNSGAGSGKQVLARTADVYSQLQAQIAAHP
jgi:V8-like Glu-specific endopeptidase